MKTRLWTSLMLLLWFAFCPSSSAAADFLGDAIRKGLHQLPGLDLPQDPAAVRGLDGLFRMVGEEEAQIRANPVARTTDLLKKVFAR
jgi:hypothetical protein